MGRFWDYVSGVNQVRHFVTQPSYVLYRGLVFELESEAFRILVSSPNTGGGNFLFRFYHFLTKYLVYGATLIPIVVKITCENTPKARYRYAEHFREILTL